ncbi:MAG: Yip1 family protein [Bacteroidota bacterium]
MTDYQSDANEAVNDLTDREIFSKIWFSPREVFRYLSRHEYDKYVPLLLIIGGISRTLDRAVEKSMGDDYSLVAILLISVFLGGLLGWISLYIYSVLMSWMGTWLGGKSDTKSVLRVLAHALIPSLFSLIFVAVSIIIYGKEIFVSEPRYLGSIDGIILLVLGIIEIALSIWSFIVLVAGISEIQSFSVGKALLNVLLPGIVFVGLIMTILIISTILVG